MPSSFNIHNDPHYPYSMDKEEPTSTGNRAEAGKRHLGFTATRGNGPCLSHRGLHSDPVSLPHLLPPLGLTR